jgi:hypothetical protein
MESKPVQHSQHTPQKPEVDLSRVLSENSEIIDDLKSASFDNITNIFARRSEAKPLEGRVSENPSMGSSNKADRVFRKGQRQGQRKTT